MTLILGPMLKRAMMFGFALFLVVLFLVSFNATAADYEPNNSFESAETVGSGSHSGSVDILTDNDDFYKVTIGGDTRMTIELEKTDSSEWGISVKSYDTNRKEDYSIVMFVSEQGEKDDDRLNNYGDSSETYYLKVSGGGSYEFIIDFEDSSISCCGSVLVISGVLVAVVGIGAVLAVKKTRQ
jgi:hypothetical protein